MRLALTALALALLLVLPGTASGAAGLTVSPLIVDLRLKRGESATKLVTITASGDQPLTVKFEHADFGFRDSGYELQLIEDSSPRTVAFSTRGWFSVPQVLYRLSAGESVQVPLRISVPSNATAGTHLGAAFFRTINEADETAGSSIATSARSGPLVFVGVKGGSPPRPRLAPLQAPRLTDDGPIAASFKIGNAGETHYRFSGELSLGGPSGTTRTTLESRYVVPDLDRRFRETIGNSSLSPGLYTLRLKLQVNPGQQEITASRRILIVPVWLRLLLLAAAVAVATAGALLVKVLWARRLARAELDLAEKPDLSDPTDKP